MEKLSRFLRSFILKLRWQGFRVDNEKPPALLSQNRGEVGAWLCCRCFNHLYEGVELPDQLLGSYWLRCIARMKLLVGVGGFNMVSVEM